MGIDFSGILHYSIFDCFCLPGLLLKTFQGEDQGHMSFEVYLITGL